MAYFLDATLAQQVRDEQKGFSPSSSRPRAGGANTGGGRKNRYAAPCIKCGRRVPAGEGSLENSNGTWITSHLDRCP
jgi:hypothetical protein